MDFYSCTHSPISYREVYEIYQSYCETCILFLQNVVQNDVHKLFEIPKRRKKMKKRKKGLTKEEQSSIINKLSARWGADTAVKAA